MTLTKPRPATDPGPDPTGSFITVSVGPRNAHTDPETGLRYYDWLGRALPSVTSIRRMAGVPHGLHQWSLTKVIDAALDRQRTIAERLGSGDPAQVQLVRRELRAAATADRDTAAKLGTAVHDAAAAGKSLTEVPAEVAPRLRQYLAWLAASGAVVLASEFQCWHLTAGYAGTADLLVRLRDGSVWLIDLKTGKGVYSDHAGQLSAYLHAEFVGADGVVDETLTALLRGATGMAVLHLSDTGWEFLQVRDDRDTWAAFRGLLEFSRWSAEHAQPETFVTARREGAG